MTAAIAGQLSLYDALGAPPPGPIEPTDPAESADAAEAPEAVPDTVEAAPDDSGRKAIDDSGPEPGLPSLEVEVIRSRRRRKTAQAFLTGSRIEVRIPATCTVAEERSFVDHFVTKFERSRQAALVDLERRAATLADRYGLPKPRTIRWVTNQTQQWGSCTPSEASIRLSDRMAGFPKWVIDYVIVHELAHLVEADHGPKFWTLVNAYPKTERARGYLMAKDGV